MDRKNLYKLLKKNIFKVISFYSIISLLLFFVYCVNEYGIIVIRSKIEQYGYWAPLAIFLLRFTSIIIPALPSTAYSLLSGGLLGFQKGIVVICLADLTSCSTSFFISRKYGRRLVRKFVGNGFMNRIEKITKRHLEDNFFLMTGFLMTGLFDFVCYAIGLTRTPLKKFLPALMISIILSNPPVVALGAGVLEGGKQLLVIALFFIFLLSIITARIRSRNQTLFDNTQ